jgi:muramoyltetrapeptide carboxypeptidase LdcA involved in peptidoglycan recycling
MQETLVQPREAVPGDRVAVLSPSFAAPGFAPDVHEQAMRRLEELTGLRPVEFPTTRRLGASARDRAADINAAFADPGIRAVLATIGGDDQITVVPHLYPAPVRNDPKPFLGTSDNTNEVNWLWTQGVAAFYGGSTQVHLGPRPAVDAVHARSLRAALLTGGRLEITEPGESEDFGRDWRDPATLTEDGDREPTEPWTWGRPAPASDRPDVGRLRRGPAVDPHGRTVPGRPGRAGWRRPAPGILRGTHPGPGIRPDPAQPR